MFLRHDRYAAGLMVEGEGSKGGGLLAEESGTDGGGAFCITRDEAAVDEARFSADGESQFLRPFFNHAPRTARCDVRGLQDGRIESRIGERDLYVAIDVSRG